MLVAVFVAVILTLGIKAPEGSVTEPVMAPVVVCAMAADASANKAITTAKNLIFIE